MIVVDSSVLFTALVDDQESGARTRDRLLGERLAAPELIDLEIVSVLRRYLTTGGIEIARANQAMTDLGSLPLSRMSHRRLIGRCWELRANITAYDAAYVALAELLDVPLLTADRKLARAPNTTCTFELVR